MIRWEDTDNAYSGADFENLDHYAWWLQTKYWLKTDNMADIATGGTFPCPGPLGTVSRPQAMTQWTVTQTTPIEDFENTEYSTETDPPYFTGYIPLSETQTRDHPPVPTWFTVQVSWDFSVQGYWSECAGPIDPDVTDAITILGGADVDATPFGTDPPRQQSDPLALTSMLVALRRPNGNRLYQGPLKAGVPDVAREYLFTYDEIVGQLAVEFHGHTASAAGSQFQTYVFPYYELEAPPAPPKFMAWV